jgi:hypothetical protein
MVGFRKQKRVFALSQLTIPVIVAGEEAIMNVDYFSLGFNLGVAIVVISIFFVLFLAVSPHYLKYKKVETDLDEDEMDRKMKTIFGCVAIPLSIIALGLMTFSMNSSQPSLHEEIVKKVVWVVPEPTDVPEFVEGVVAEAPIPLGGGICLVGVSIDAVHDGRDVRAVLVSADRPLVLGQKVKVKIRLISDTYRPVSDLLVIQDDTLK